MKRCPQCLFIYPESDTRCDFDNTPLVVVDETELEAVTGQQPQTPPAPPSTLPRSSKKGPRKPRSSGKRQRKVLLVAAVVGLLFGVVAVLAYYKLTHRTSNLPETQSLASVSAVPITAPRSPVVDPSPFDTPSPSPSPPATPKSTPAPARVATAHSGTTVAPVSTSGPGIGKKLGGKPIIFLTSGGKIAADEVWRTRGGVWYRRDGIVTLLKHNRVKAIANQ